MSDYPPRFTPVVEANHRLSDRVREVEEELETVKKDRANWQLRHRLLDDRVSSMSVRNENLRRENEKLNAELDKWRDENADLVARVVELEDERDIYKETVEEREKRLQNLENGEVLRLSQNSTLYWRKRFEAVSKEAADWRASAEESARKIAGLQADLVNKDKDVATLNREIDRLRATIYPTATEELALLGRINKWRDALNREGKQAAILGDYAKAGTNYAVATVLGSIANGEEPRS